jgi:cytoskeletal protein CcmA (bactofilin family)
VKRSGWGDLAPCHIVEEAGTARKEKSMLGQRKIQVSEATEGKLDTIVGREAIVKGEVKVKGSLRIDGQVEGTIDSSETVVVGKTGRVSGQVKAKHAIIAGDVSGDLFLSSLGVLETGSRLSGDIVCQGLIVHEGVFFEGRCQRRDGKAGAAAKETGEVARAGRGAEVRNEPRDAGP